MGVQMWSRRALEFYLRRNVHVRKGMALKLCQISFHALQSTASETVTFTWPSIPPPVAAGPRRWLNQAQGPVDEERWNKEERANVLCRSRTQGTQAYVQSHVSLKSHLWCKYSLCRNMSYGKIWEYNIICCIIFSLKWWQMIVAAAKILLFR